MKAAIFSTKPYDREYFNRLNGSYGHDLTFYDCHLSLETVALAQGFAAICPFVSDTLDEPVLKALAENGTRLLALRSAGYNHVDVRAAEKYGFTVARVPAYSPYAVAEHTVGLMLALNRKIHRAFNRVRESNFSLDGLMGFDMHEKTVGIIGTGKIGTVVTRILTGFGCRLLAYDPLPNPDCQKLDVTYVSLEKLFQESDIITLHCPLLPDTHHLINEKAIQTMKPGVMLINTSRGAVIDTPAVIAGLKTGQVGYLGLDVYEEEGDLFFEDLSNKVIQDDVFMRLLTFPNVIITGHQAFFTEEAMSNIAKTTLQNIQNFEQGQIPEENLVVSSKQLAASKK